MRFHIKDKKNSFEFEWNDDGSNIFRPNGIKRRQFVVVKLSGFSLIIGQVIKFQYIGMKSIPKRRYTYDSMIFGINENVEMQLAPAFEVEKNSSHLKPLDYTDFIPCKNYLCHIRKDAINMSSTPQFRDKDDY